MKKLSYNDYEFKGSPRNITWHWTGGSYVPSSLDAEHYHFLIAKEGSEIVVYLGKYGAEDNDSTGDGEYAAHVKGFNTRNIGIGVCGMHGARERGDLGRYPLTKGQIKAMCKLTAFLCKGYGIEVGEKTVASHCEIERIHGIKQRGKWDISEVGWKTEMWKELNDWFREEVRGYLGESGGGEAPPSNSVVEVRVPRGSGVEVAVVYV